MVCNKKTYSLPHNFRISFYCSLKEMISHGHSDVSQVENGVNMQSISYLNCICHSRTILQSMLHGTFTHLSSFTLYFFAMIYEMLFMILDFFSWNTINERWHFTILFSMVGFTYINLLWWFYNIFCYMKICYVPII